MDPDHAKQKLHVASREAHERATFVADRLHVLLNDTDMVPGSKQTHREAVKSVQLFHLSASLIRERSSKSA